jgi:hypothetical protein
VGKHSDLIRTLAEQVLGAGEPVIETVLVNYNGTMPATSLPGSAARSGDPDAQVTFPSARQMAIGVTDRQLVVFSLAFSGKPKQHIGTVPLSAVTEVGFAETRMSGVLRLTLRSGARVDLEVLRGEPAEAFVAALEERVAPPPPSADGPGLASWDAPMDGDDLRRAEAEGGDEDRPLPPVFMAALPSLAPDDPAPVGGSLPPPPDAPSAPLPPPPVDERPPPPAG